MKERLNLWRGVNCPTKLLKSNLQKKKLLKNKNKNQTNVRFPNLLGHIEDPIFTQSVNNCPNESDLCGYLDPIFHLYRIIIPITGLL